MSEENKDLGDKAEEAFDKAKDAAKEAAEDVKEAAGKAKEKANEFAEEAGEKFDQAKEKASEFAHDAKEKASEFAKDAKEAAGNFADEAKKTANEFSDSVKQTFSGGGGDNKKILAGLLGIFLGAFGVHKFVLGYQKEGFILLGISLVGMATSCLGFGVFLVWIAGIIGLIEGIIYITKSDEDFYNTYQVGKKPWF